MHALGAGRREWLAVTGIILAGVAIRLFFITQPFVDMWGWREADVAMIAENFYRNGYNIFYPQINWGGSGPGYVGTEFPLLSWVAAVLYRIFGVQEWVGRSLCVASFAAAMPAIYLLGRRMVSRSTALLALAIFALIPLSVSVARSFMPDMPSLALTLWAMELHVRWSEDQRRVGCFAGAVVTAALAMLVKITALVLAPVLLLLAIRAGGWRVLRRPLFWVIPVAAVIPSVFWYRHAFYIGRTWFPYHAFGSDGLQWLPWELYSRYASYALNYSLTLLCCAVAALGLVLAVWRKCWPLVAWVLVMVFYFFVAGRGNRHPWYQLPLTPAVALLAAMPLTAVGEKVVKNGVALRGMRVVVASLFFAGLAFASFRSVKSMYLLDGQLAYFMPAAQAVRQHVPPGELVVVGVLSGDPSIFYYQQRRGWLFPAWNDTGLAAGSPTDSAAAIAELEKRRGEGARYFVVALTALWWLDYYNEFQTHLDGHYKRVAQTPEYVIFDLH